MTRIPSPDVKYDTKVNLRAFYYRKTPTNPHACLVRIHQDEKEKERLRAQMSRMDIDAQPGSSGIQRTDTTVRQKGILKAKPGKTAMEPSEEMPANTNPSSQPVAEKRRRKRVRKASSKSSP